MRYDIYIYIYIVRQLRVKVTVQKRMSVKIEAMCVYMQVFIIYAII